MDGALMRRQGQMLVEAALVLPIFVVLLFLVGVLMDRSLAGMKAEEEARLAAWKGAAEKRKSAGRVRLENCECAMGANRAPSGMGSEDPLVGGWMNRMLGTSRAEAEASSPALPWGGKRLRMSAVHVVDRGRDPKGLVEWLKGKGGMRTPPNPVGR